MNPPQVYMYSPSRTLLPPPSPYHPSGPSQCTFTFMHWRRKCQPTPVFFPGESQGQGSLVGGHLWGLTVRLT